MAFVSARTQRATVIPSASMYQILCLQTTVRALSLSCCTYRERERKALATIFNPTYVPAPQVV